MGDTSETLNPSIRNSVEAENYLKGENEDGAFFCWKSESEQFILTSKSNDKYHHIIIPVLQHESLSEAISVLQFSFPRKFKHPITYCENNTTDVESNPVEVTTKPANKSSMESDEAGDDAPTKTNIITDLSVAEEALEMKSNLEAPLEAAKKPLTEEEKAEKLDKLEELRKVKKAEREEGEKQEAKDKEMKRIASGKEMSGIRQAIEEQEIKKMAELHYTGGRNRMRTNLFVIKRQVMMKTFMVLKKLKLKIGFMIIMKTMISKQALIFSLVFNLTKMTVVRRMVPIPSMTALLLWILSTVRRR